ncbi:hypothetical protein GQ473_07345 [archaeon]|nr:hypothetical protein [archaeon]
MDDIIDKVIRDVIKNNRLSTDALNLSPEELKRASENSKAMVKEVEIMKSKSMVYNGVRVFDITKDMEGSMFAIAFSVCNNEKSKLHKFIASGMRLMNVNPLPDYHLKEMIKHFMAYKSSLIALQSYSKIKKKE